MSNLIKRTVPVILVLIVCISCLVFPASASSFEMPKNYFNILDYGFPNDLDSTMVELTSNTGTINFKLPGNFPINYVDILLTSSSDITSASIGSTALNVRYTDGYDRIFGDIPLKLYKEIEFSITLAEPGRVNFIFFHAFNSKTSAVPLLGYADFKVGSDIVYSEQMSSPSSTIDYTFPESNASSTYQACTINCQAAGWNEYDTLVFRVRTYLNVTSIQAMTMADSAPLPFTVTVSDDYSSYNEDPYYYIVVDISGVDRSDVDNYPYISIRGQKKTADVARSYFYDVFGYVNPSPVNPVVYLLRGFFSNLEDWFTDLKSGIVNKLSDVQYQLKTSITSFRNEVYQSHNGIKNYLSSLVTGETHNEDANSFNDSVNDQSQELEDMTNIMGSVEKPDINNIDLSTGTMVDSNSLVLATSGLSNILSNEIIVRVILMALTFGLVGFILYGKK